MNAIAHIVILGWLPFTIGLFLFLPFRRAFLASILFGWLIMPTAGYALPGLPDYTKVTALPFGLILCSLIFNAVPLLSYRPRWFDLPMLYFSVAVGVSDVWNELPYYDALSEVALWGMFFGAPYLLSRIYLCDREAIDEQARMWLIAGLSILPLFLYEVRMSPMLLYKVYGIYRASFFHPPRWGLGYRPIVFLNDGLELAVVFLALSVIAAACWIWKVPRWFRYFGPLTLFLVMLGAMILTKSAGAIQLYGLGMVVLVSTRRMRSMIPVLLLALLPLTYMGLRISGAWSGQSMVDAQQSILGEDRASSLQTRIDNENLLIGKALQKPYLGWGGAGRNRVSNDRGKDITITDGLWVILLGTTGMAGLGAFTLAFSLPALMLTRRLGRREIPEPESALPIAMAVILILFLLDCLSNAFPNEMFTVLCGGLMGYAANMTKLSPPSTTERLLAEADAHLEAGDADAAEAAYTAVAEVCTRTLRTNPSNLEARIRLAGCEAAIARIMQSTGRLDEALALRLEQVAVWEGLVAERQGEPSRIEGLALALADLGRVYRMAGQPDESRDTWLRSIETWDSLIALAPDDAEVRSHRADACNDLAWSLVGHSDRLQDDLLLAVELARQAVDADSQREDYWNTLGTAYFHGGQWKSAASSFQTACDLTDGGTAFDLFPLAMAYQQLGNDAGAREAFRKGCLWMDANRPDDHDLLLARNNAASWLRVNEPIANP
ncbi:MAG: hypothetical protein U0794_01575 [Isosphaeraceae bacterium]